MITSLYPAHAPLFINSLSARFSAVQAIGPTQPGIGNLASAGWPAANRALYIPIGLPFAYPVKRAFWVNGATATGNVDLGLFDALTGTKLYSTGATAQSGANAAQYVTVDWLVQPGEYYLALSFSSATGTAWRTTGISATDMRSVGCLQEANANPLPTSMTPAAVASAYWPLFGLTRTPSGY